MESGIYKIENIINNKKYIGSAKNIEKRWYQHKYALNNNCHDNSYLQNAWNKYGANNFKFDVLEKVKPEKLIEREQHYINLHDACNKIVGYNLAPTAGNTLGFKFSEESKLNMCYMKKGKPSSRKNYKMSDKTKEKIGNANKISQLGRTHSEKTIEKMKKPHGAMKETTKKQISDWRKGLIPSKKTGKFITNDIKNTLLTEEVINKTKIINKNNKYRSNQKSTNISKKKILNSNKGNNRGENNGMSISNENEVLAIRKDYANGLLISELMIKYNKKYIFIYKIIKRLRWDWLDNSSFSD
ncbi:MAG: GIY-YIG nuclease family protein [Candidatus Paceibacterota bacterium]|jgi:group I intron endonuclease